MSLIVIDKDKCKRDGFCAAECPMQIIQLSGPEGYPAPAAGAEELCIDCGHCVAVCPHDALSQRAMGPADCPPVQGELLPSFEQTEHLLRARRSARVFKPEPLGREVLARLIDVARHAPSGHNTQPVEWLVIQEPAEVRRLAGVVADWMRRVIVDQPELAARIHLKEAVAVWDQGLDRICRGAPHVIVALGDKSLGPTLTFASVIALTHLELAAQSLGLGVCWGGYFNLAAVNYKPMTEALAIPEGKQTQGALLIGRPAHRYRRAPARRPARITWR